MNYEVPDHTYVPMLDHNGERVARAVHEIAVAPPGGVVIHCHSGRDRTGLLVALLLGIAGVDADAIAADFARTPGTDPAAMRDTLTHADARYGGVVPYLLLHGVPPTEVTAIRHRLLEP